MATLKQGLTATGFNQGDQHALYENMIALVNDMKTKVNALRADVVAMRGNLNSMHASLIVSTLTGTYSISALTATTVTIADLSMAAGATQ